MAPGIRDLDDEDLRSAAEGVVELKNEVLRELDLKNELKNEALHAPELHAPELHAPELHAPELHAPELHAPELQRRSAARNLFGSEARD